MTSQPSRPATSPPPVFGTLESALYATDLDAAEAFWTQVVGLRLFQKVPGRHVFFRVADGPPPQVLLVFNPEATLQPAPADALLQIPPHGTTGPGHYCLGVGAQRLEDWRTHLEACGYPVEADIQWPSRGRSLYVRDPAGNSIEFADPAIWAGVI